MVYLSTNALWTIFSVANGTIYVTNVLWRSVNSCNLYHSFFVSKLNRERLGVQSLVGMRTVFVFNEGALATANYCKMYTKTNHQNQPTCYVRYGWSWSVMIIFKVLYSALNILDVFWSCKLRNTWNIFWLYWINRRIVNIWDLIRDSLLILDILFI